MNKIKFELEIDLTDSKSVLALSNFLSEVAGVEKTTISGGEKISVVEVKQEAKQEAKQADLPKKEEKPKKEEATKKIEEPKEETAKKVEEPKEETAKKEEKPKEETANEGISIVEVRALLAKKVGEFRTEIKNELTRLGASSVTTLDADKYQEFSDFLNSLG